MQQTREKRSKDPEDSQEQGYMTKESSHAKKQRNSQLFCKFCKKDNHTIDNCRKLKHQQENGGAIPTYRQSKRQSGSPTDAHDEEYVIALLLSDHKLVS